MDTPAAEEEVASTAHRLILPLSLFLGVLNFAHHRDTLVSTTFDLRVLENNNEKKGKKRWLHST